VPTQYAPLPNSTYLDYDSYRSDAPSPTGAGAVGNFTFNVALVLDRANDPTALLNSDWASRQQQLESLTDSGTLWSTYGANPAAYNQVLAQLGGLGIHTVNQIDPVNGYVSSAESRTIWVQVDQSNFATLFGTPLVAGHDQAGNAVAYWQGNLSLPQPLAVLGVQGLWFDTDMFGTVLAPSGAGAAAALPQGAQGIGNSAPRGDVILDPQDIAQNYYNFPLSGALWDPSSGHAVSTGTIGLLEPGIGSALGPDMPAGEFQALLDAYRQAMGISTSGRVTTLALGGQQVTSDASERSLDVGVATAINPQSPLVLYAGSGFSDNANADAYTAYQAAIWDTVNDPDVISSSYRFHPTMAAPGSPFLFAVDQLFVDAALRGITVLTSAGDGGSGGWTGDGVTNVVTTRGSPYDLMIGGTSFSTLAAAGADPTLADVLTLAMAGDPATIWDLVAGGLVALPASSGPASHFVEAVWNTYALDGSTFAKNGYLGNLAGAGGADSSHAVPSYQSDFGLMPTTADPAALVGRGLPDVSANAGGNLFYAVPAAAMDGLRDGGGGGTSASAPLWAALISQFNAIFHDQGLPKLGYMNDLLYIAAAIAPGSFNDVTLGNNVSSFALGGAYSDAETGTAITPTGYGYQAGPGYDLATGLGSPNGLLLARALTDIAHSEMWFNASPEVIAADSHGGWNSGADQSLLFQTMSNAVTAIGIHLGPDAFGFFSPESASFAWTSRMAEQSLQADFDPALVIMFDKQAQGGLAEAHVSSGEALAVSIGASPAQAIQADLSSPFGFADFLSGDTAVRVARPVAVAETADAHNDQTAIVRLRQDGQDNLSITFYRVDDLSGTINGLHPGDPGYQAAVQGRAYQMTSGGTSIGGPGYGNYEQTGLSHVNAGDLVAMQLTNNTHGNVYSGFAQANETVNGQPVGHLWNYGLNTWGWEDTYGGGDRDYNDLIVQLDFTSAAGHGWIA
jgi:hypothetical protein